MFTLSSSNAFIIIAIVSNISLLLLLFRKKLGIKNCALQFMSLLVPIFALIGLLSTFIINSNTNNSNFSQAYNLSSTFFLNNTLYLLLFIIICLLLPCFITVVVYSRFKGEDDINDKEQYQRTLDLACEPQNAEYQGKTTIFDVKNNDVIDSDITKSSKVNDLLANVNVNTLEEYKKSARSE